MHTIYACERTPPDIRAITTGGGREGGTRREALIQDAGRILDSTIPCVIAMRDVRCGRRAAHGARAGTQEQCMYVCRYGISVYVGICAHGAVRRCGAGSGRAAHPPPTYSSLLPTRATRLPARAGTPAMRDGRRTMGIPPLSSPPGASGSLAPAWRACARSSQAAIRRREKGDHTPGRWLCALIHIPCYRLGRARARRMGAADAAPDSGPSSGQRAAGPAQVRRPAP